MRPRMRIHSRVHTWVEPEKRKIETPEKKQVYVPWFLFRYVCTCVCAECVRVCACVCIGFYELLLLLLLLFLFQLRPALTFYLLPRYNSCGKRYPQDTWCEGLRERNCDALNITKRLTADCNKFQVREHESPRTLNFERQTQNALRQELVVAGLGFPCRGLAWLGDRTAAAAAGWS